MNSQRAKRACRGAAADPAKPDAAAHGTRRAGVGPQPASLDGAGAQPPSYCQAMLLRLERVSRSFGGVQAVDGASFAVRQGDIHGLIGPNGAGKTTLLNMVSGLIPLTR